VVIINKQKKKMNLRFNLNVEFEKIKGFLTKNPLTTKKIDCIMISASEIFAATVEPYINNTTAAHQRIGELYMFVREVTVKNQVGLHARPATFFIQKANEFKASIWIEKEERRVNAKSLLGILSLGIVGGTTIKVIADGADEKAAVDALIDLVDSGFSEENR